MKTTMAWLLLSLMTSTVMAQDPEVPPLRPGQTYYEGPDDVHVVGWNASHTKPAKFLVFLVKNKGAPPLVPVK